MTIERTMIIPLLTLIVVVLAAGVLIDRQIKYASDHEQMLKHVAGIERVCRLQESE